MSLCRALSHTPLQMISQNCMQPPEIQEKRYDKNICHLIRLYIVDIYCDQDGGGGGGEGGLKL